MSKLFKLKEWLTIPDAARHLSIAFGEEVSESDVLRLALDGHLKLSVNFVNHTEARCGKIVPIDEAEYKEVPSLNGVGTVRLYGGPTLFVEGRKTHVIKLENTIATLAGVYDLPMIGDERLDVEHLYQQHTGGPAVTLSGLDGAFVEGKDGVICQLQDDYDGNEYCAGSTAQLRELKERIVIKEIEESEAQKLLDKHKQDRAIFLKKRKSQEKPDNFYPAGGLPQDAVLVVRTAALREFEQTVNDTPAQAEKPMATTERNTLLTIIAALCDYSAIDPAGRGAAGQLAKMSEEVGAPVTDDTIRKVLAKIPDALESRKK